MPMNQEWNRRFNEVMPFGSSTCSKAPKLMPDEPAVIVRGKGCRVWDADGREFIDYRNGLGPVTLGYCFPEVDDAIIEQLKNGVIYGQPHPLECEVAELLCDAIPSAEQARFLKTGGEAISACIRIARQFTGKDHVIQIGYNGWLNSLGAGGRTLPSQEASGTPAGVPKALSDLHHPCPWNDIDALEQWLEAYPNNVAAVVISANYKDIASGETFYPAVRSLVDRYETLLVFDEIVTGFRVALGGVQEHFGVTPDLTVFAKGIANGMPLAVYAGRRDVMNALNKAIVSSTYGGETLSLAAAKATVKVYRKYGVIEQLWKNGTKLWDGFKRIADSVGVPIQTAGYPTCPALIFDGEPDLKERFFREMYRNGVSLYTVNYINFSHKEADVDETLQRMEKALKNL